jgi:glycosyltransferase involved in cell wall biosynthesis
MVEKVLTIGIPTYNGALRISSTLDSMLAQVSEIDRALIEILVSDNCSTDGTYELVEGYKEKFPDLINVFRNESNVGYDRNVDLLFKRAKSQYVWAIGDDDIVNSSALVQIMQFLNSSGTRCDLIHVGGTSEEALQENKFCNQDGNEFLLSSSFRSGWLSSTIFKAAKWNSIDTTRFFGTNWIHYEMVIQIAVDCYSFIFCKPMIVEDDQYEKTWGHGGEFLLIGLDLVEIFQKMKTLRYKYFCRRAALRVIKGSYPQQIIKARVQGLPIDLPLIKRFAKNFYTFPSFWICDLPFLLCPKWICRLVYSMRYLTKGSLSKKVFPS